MTWGDSTSSSFSFSFFSLQNSALFSTQLFDLSQSLAALLLQREKLPPSVGYSPLLLFFLDGDNLFAA
jgi:hypothetical protein